MSTQLQPINQSWMTPENLLAWGIQHNMPDKQQAYIVINQWIADQMNVPRAAYLTSENIIAILDRSGQRIGQMAAPLWLITLFRPNGQARPISRTWGDCRDSALPFVGRYLQGGE